MIEKLEFRNFKALRNTSLDLRPLTLLMGPNGSGKSTVLQALEAAAQPDRIDASKCRSVGVDSSGKIELLIDLRLADVAGRVHFWWPPTKTGINLDSQLERCRDQVLALLKNVRVYSLDANAIAAPAQVSNKPLEKNGGNLAAVLDNIKDNHPERWDALLKELRTWLPEYDHILFPSPSAGQKGLALRTRIGGHQIPAQHLSQGTLIALALLGIAYAPDAPSLIGLEEVDRGLHPRLLRNVRDALYRLSYPESVGETRSPIQIIATSHSPYLLDLFREHPEEVVLAEKKGLEAEFRSLSEVPNFEEILGDASLGDVWYSGILGGVPILP